MYTYFDDCRRFLRAHTQTRQLEMEQSTVWSFTQHRKSIKQLLCAEIIIIIFHENHLIPSLHCYCCCCCRRRRLLPSSSSTGFGHTTSHMKHLNPTKTIRLFRHLSLLPPKDTTYSPFHDFLCARNVFVPRTDH